jgi:hypothetical protein
MTKKVGYLFTSLKVDPANPARAIAVNEFFFKASVGTRTSERWLRDTRVYESKPGGKLLSFTYEQKGDGGNQTLVASLGDKGLKVVRQRPGLADEVLGAAFPKETVEDADQARVAIKRNAKLTGTITDGTDLEQYPISSTPGTFETRVVGGLKVKVQKVTTLSEKEKVPADAFVDEKGRMLEIQMGPTMRAVLEPEDVAKRLDSVEVFAMTRVVLPKDPPLEARNVPGELVMVMTGLPDKFHKDTARQTYKALEGGKVEVTLRAPSVKNVKSVRPLVDPNGGMYLKSSIIVEADNPDIKALAKKIAGSEKNAWVATKRVSRWVYENLIKDYGSSSDRASDVLKTMRGDCTEHSLLTATLLRALGIPARRIDGVVYLKNDDGVPALYWHEWVEAWIGEWVQVDPTFGQDIADATHFAVGEEGNAEIVPLIGTLKVVEVR